MKPRVSIIGTPSETEHHVAPFADQFNIDSLLPEQATSSLKAGDLAIFFSEHFDRFRNCCIELKRKNIATLYMVDGILEWRNAWENRPTEPACPWTMRTALSHKVAVIGSSQYRQLWHWGNQENWSWLVSLDLTS
ncbi:MAG: hypothetical protein R3C03_14015 [Pirellulaceae bacterium]